MNLRKKLTTGHFLDFDEAFDSSKMKDKFGIYTDAARTVVSAIQAGFFDDVSVNNEEEAIAIVRELEPLETRKLASDINDDYIKKYKPSGADPN